MSAGKELEDIHRQAAPALGVVCNAIVVKKISRREIAAAADVLEEAANRLRRVVGVDK